MIKYTCKSCNITTELSECPHCGERTEIVNSTIYWCKFCNIPTFDEHCPICGSKGKRIGSDIRPVFPQERLLLEILLDCPLKYKNSSVWNTAGNYYYADGEKLPFTASQTKDVDADYIRAQLKLYEVQNQNTAFEAVIEKFLPSAPDTTVLHISMIILTTSRIMARLELASDNSIQKKTSMH